jgi:hypothetical protein
MLRSGSNLGGEGSKEMGVVNRYLSSMVAPLKTLTFKEGVLLMEEVNALKTEGTMEGKTGDSRGHRLQVWYCDKA